MRARSRTSSVIQPSTSATVCGSLPHEVPLIPASGQGVVELAQAAVSFVREQSELLTAQTIYLQRAILDALRYNIPSIRLFVGWSGQNSSDDIKGAM